MNDNSFTDWSAMSDKALMESIGSFVKQHRLKQNRSQSDVSVAADISRSTLSLLERGERVSLNSLIQVLRVLDLLHIMGVFKTETEISPIEYARLQRMKRQRARSGKPSRTDDRRSKGSSTKSDQDIEW
jgi:transcriptional regulator with XRE-family HTH domain